MSKGLCGNIQTLILVKALLDPGLLGGDGASCLPACLYPVVVADGGLLPAGGFLFTALSFVWFLRACSGSLKLESFLGAGGGGLLPAFDALLPKPNGSLKVPGLVAFLPGCAVVWLAAGFWPLAAGSLLVVAGEGGLLPAFAAWLVVAEDHSRRQLASRTCMHGWRWQCIR